MDIISMLEADHRKVEELFARYERGDHEVIAEIAEELELHTRIEEEVLYPEMATSLPDGQEKVDHAKREHDKVDEFLAELKESPDNDDCFQDLKGEVDHHVQEEESDLFPSMREACAADRLNEMGQQAEDIKASA